MDAFWSGPAARFFALCTTVLAAKLLLLAAYAALVSRRSAADAAQEAGDDAAEPAPLPVRIAAARRDDLEGLALFFVAGLLFLRLGGPGELVAQLLFAPFTVASIFASWFQVAGLRRWRALNRGIGWVCLALMTGHVISALLRAA